jgi:hypothetical protein
MILDGRFPVGFLQLLLRRSHGDSKNLVVSSTVTLLWLFAAEHRYKIFLIFREEEDKTKTKTKKKKTKTKRISKNPKAVKTPDS